ncbi:MAG: hypothetical protein ABIR50_00725 [Ginsengibacter sp.]
MQNFKPEYKIWNWKKIYMLHWIINPGLAINELFLGQRVAKIMLIKEDPSKTLSEKSFVPCPHCGTIHPSLEWSSQNKTGYGNWFGLYCNHCGKVIPCLRNFTSLLIIITTSPIWIWFKKDLKKRWLIIQKEKFSKPLKLTVPEFVVWRQGLLIGFGYYVLVMFTKFVVFDDVLTWKKPIGNLIGALFIGFISAALIKEMFMKKSAVKHSSNQ